MKTMFAIVFSGLFLNASCGKEDDSNQQTPPIATHPPVETQPANTTYQPAFQGQTRAPGVRTQKALDVQVLSAGLSRPWGIISLPDGRLLITEKGGTLRLSTPDGALSNPITGLPPVNDGGQGGLLDVVADADFGNNRILYWTFSENVSGGTVTAVAKGTLAANEQRIENAQVIYRALPAYNGVNHYGGRILLDRNGNLFVSTGDRADLATRPKAQDLTAALGKVLRIDRNGQPVVGNPFQNQGNYQAAIYSYGHRNPQSLALHPETGDLWEAEMGPRGGDEVNRIEAGKNYGWPVITYGVEYSGAAIGQAITQQTGMEQPVYYWDPVVSTSGMIFHSGTGISEWKNNLLIGCLSGQHIVRLLLNGNRIVGEERLLADQGERFRDLAEGRAGAVYAVTDGGKLYRIQPR